MEEAIKTILKNKNIILDNITYNNVILVGN